jgi:flagellar biosynthesis protein FliR
MGARLPLDWVFASLLLSLRVAPAFAFAPPFNLTRVPTLFRVLFGVGIAAAMFGAMPTQTELNLNAGRILTASVSELAIGLVFVLALQIMFGALDVAGRTLDIQAGFGLAGVLNPATGEQAPLIGTLLAYGAAATFFSLDGGGSILRIVRASLDAIPLGSAAFTISLARLFSFMSGAFLVAFGIAGAAILCLFIADLAIAMLSRTVPQMNVLILGLQVKTILILIVLPTTFGFAGALFARLVAQTLNAIAAVL